MQPTQSNLHVETLWCYTEDNALCLGAINDIYSIFCRGRSREDVIYGTADKGSLFNMDPEDLELVFTE